MSERLRVLFHDRLTAFLFPGRESDFRALVLRSLASALPKEGECYLLSPERLSELEKALASLRRLFQVQLGEAPFPFTLFPEGRRPPLPRPGRIYVSSKARGALEEAARKMEFLVQFEPEGELVELKLPSTSPPETLFSVRDLLWVGDKGPCFYCDLPWHETARCPGLREIVPGRAFRGYLKLPLKALGPKISEAILSRKLQAEDLLGLYARYFYFLPAFLKVLFYKAPEGARFAQVALAQEITGKGGNLQIGLECLTNGEISEAEKRFLAEGVGDYRSILGMVQVAVLQGDPEKAFYYLEELSLEHLPPLVQAAAILLKGRIFEWQKDYTSAERSYAESLKRDSSFHPAAYHRLRVGFLLGGEVRRLDPFKAYFGHPILYGLAFLEPVFLPMAKTLEKELLSREEEKQAQALSAIREAEDELHRLKSLLSEEERSDLEDRLHRLRQEVYQGSFYELERAALKASELALEMKGYTYRKIRELRDGLSDYYQRYLALKRYWQRYPYQTEARFWGRKLREIGERLTRVEHQLERDPVKEFTRLLKEFERLSRLFEEIEAEKRELEAKRLFRQQLYLFLKVFFLGESLLFILFFTLPSFLAATLPEVLPYLPFNLSTFIWCSLGVLLLAVILALTRR